VNALVLDQTGVERRQDPKPGPGDAVLRVDYCGICGSTCTHNQRFAIGIALGHASS